MKKTIKINLSGLVFTLDEDAYQALKDYLDAINSRFRDLEEGAEIIADIEARIAEIFQSKITGKKSVITLDDVNEVIKIMGKPEDFIGAEEMGGETYEGERQYYRKRHRKLYRDPDNAILGGVAGGLAAYLGIEPWIIRLLLVILTFPIQVIPIIYIILWIVVPKAETAAQKLEMRGEKVTVSNIEKTIKEEYETVKDNVRRVKQSNEYKKTRNVIDEIFHALGQIILFLLKVVLFFIGIAFIIAGVAAIMGLTGMFFFRHAVFPIEIWGGHFYSFHELLGYFTNPANFTIFSVALFFAIAIPIIALIYGGIKLIFRFKANDKAIGLTGLVLWLISVIFLVTMAAYEGSNFTSLGESIESDYLRSFNSDTLIVSMQPEQDIEGFNDSWFYDDDDKWHIITSEDRIYGKIDLDIEFTGNDRFKVVVLKRSQGKSRLAAMRNSERLRYNYDQDGSFLYLDPYFSLDKVFRWRMPDTEVTISVPEGKYIHLDRNTRYFLDNVEDVPDSQVRELAGKTLVMTEDGLQKGD